MKNINSSECEMAREWDSEKRSSPYSTVADVEDEFCDCCQTDLGKGDCEICAEVAAEDAAASRDQSIGLGLPSPNQYREQARSLFARI
jgi:hypothetical protein